MNTQKLFKILSLVSISVLLLTGCESTKNAFNKMSWPSFGSSSDKTKLAAKDGCPQISIMPELGSITQLRGNSVISQTVIGSASTTCTTTPSAATVRLSIGFSGQLGPEGVKDATVEASYSIPYLVAVVNPQGDIISKDVFAISMTYKNGQTHQTFPDLLEQVIPLKPKENAGLYKIMVGFQLNEQELAYNRSFAAKSSNK